MTVLDEINATYYAMRLISHRIDVSCLLLEEETAHSVEFSPEERKLAFEIIENIQQRENALLQNLSESKVEAYLNSLADRVEELANKEIAAAGYDIEKGRQLLENLRSDSSADLHSRKGASISDMVFTNTAGKTDLPSKTGHGLNLVAIGGGGGLAFLLRGLKDLVDRPYREGEWLQSLSAVVTISDESSKVVHHEIQMGPREMGNYIVALAEDSHLVSRLFQHSRGSLGIDGHRFVDLFLDALTEVTGDFVEAVRLSSAVLASKGRLYPATINDVRLVAELEDGTEVYSKASIKALHGQIHRIRLEPEQCLPLPEALSAIRHADVITIGPGSLYTSILPNLLVPRVAQAIGQSRAIKMFICNIMTEPGPTYGYTVSQHLKTLKSYAPEIQFDYIIVNDRRIGDQLDAPYAAQGMHQTGLTEPLEMEFGPEMEIIRADLIDEGSQSWNPKHSPEKLSNVIIACCKRATKGTRTTLTSTSPR